MEEPAIYITWAIFSLISLAFTVIAWIVIARTPSRKNGIHAFVTSLLTSRALFCLSVTWLYVGYGFSGVTWSVLSCHALYWLWTVSWSTDMFVVITSVCWALVKLSYPSSAFRLASTVVITAMWLVSTTLAGLFTYFNTDIKSENLLDQYGCSVLPHPSHTSLNTGLLVVLLLFSVISIALFLTFIVKLRISLRNEKKDLQRSQNVCEIAKGNTCQTGVALGIDNLDCIEVAKEPGRLEAIEDTEERRRLRTGGGVHLSVLDVELLETWRRVYCITQALVILLNITPQMVFLCLSLFSTTPYSDSRIVVMVVVSCHLMYCLLLPFLLVMVSPEYRAVLSSLRDIKCSDILPHTKTEDGEVVPREQLSIKSRAKSVPSLEAVQVIRPATPPPRPQSAATMGATSSSRRPVNLGRRMSAPSIRRSESGLSRLEWKEQMREKLKLPPLPSLDSIQQDLDAIGEGESSKMDIQHQESRQSTRSSATESEDSESEAGFDYNDSDIERVLKRQSSGIDNEGYEDEENTAELGKIHRQQVVCIVEQPEDKDEGVVVAEPTQNSPIHSEPEPNDTFGNSIETLEPIDQPFAATNPFLQDSGIQGTEKDSLSDRSIEAEIVSITIKGKGSLKKRLKEHGLWPGGTYLKRPNKSFISSLTLKPRYNNHNALPTTSGDESSQPATIADQCHQKAKTVNTNPFIDDIDSTPPTQYRGEEREEANFADIKHWLASMDDLCTLHVQSDDAINEECSWINKRKAASNPFLQDIRDLEYGVQTSTPIHACFPSGSHSLSYSDSVRRCSRSAPSSPSTLRRTSSVSIAPGSFQATPWTGGSDGSISDEETYTVYGYDRPQSSCSYKRATSEISNGDGKSSGNHYITPYI